MTFQVSDTDLKTHPIRATASARPVVLPFRRGHSGHHHQRSPGCQAAAADPVAPADLAEQTCQARNRYCTCRVLINLEPARPTEPSADC